MAPFAPDNLVFVTSTPSLAAKRIAARRHGNSRFDGSDYDQIAERLKSAQALLEELIGLYRATSGVAVVELKATAQPKPNAAAIDRLLV